MTDKNTSLPKTAREIIALFPSPAYCAEYLGISVITVRQWANRDNIPSKYWPDMISEAALMKIELTADDFINMKKEEAA